MLRISGDRRRTSLRVVTGPTRSAAQRNAGCRRGAGIGEALLHTTSASFRIDEHESRVACASIPKPAVSPDRLFDSHPSHLPTEPPSQAASGSQRPPCDLRHRASRGRRGGGLDRRHKRFVRSLLACMYLLWLPQCAAYRRLVPLLLLATRSFQDAAVSCAPIATASPPSQVSRHPVARIARLRAKPWFRKRSSSPIHLKVGGSQAKPEARRWLTLIKRN